MHREATGSALDSRHYRPQGDLPQSHGRLWPGMFVNVRVVIILTGAWGTALVVVLCLTLTLAAGRDPPCLETEII